jgi:hypothetical protein
LTAATLSYLPRLVVDVWFAGGLDDVGNLLRLIGAAPFDSSHTFRRAIREPFAASVAAAEAAQQHHEQQQHDTLDDNVTCDVTAAAAYGRAQRDGVRRLLALLQPLMWRSNKEAAAADHPLPPR